MAIPKRPIKVRKRKKRIVKRKSEDAAVDGVAAAEPTPVAEAVEDAVPVTEPVAEVAEESIPVAEPVDEVYDEDLPVPEPLSDAEIAVPVPEDESDDLRETDETAPVEAYAATDAPPMGGDWRIDVTQPEQVYPEGDDEDSRTITQQIVDHPLELQEREAKPPQSKYDNLLNSIYDAVFITDLDGAILQTNVRAEEKFYMMDDALRTLNITDLIAGADRKLIEVLRDNSDRRKFTLLEAICVTEDEGRFDAEIVVNRMFGDDENLFCFFVRDVSKRKRTEQKVKEMSSKLADIEKDNKLLDRVRSLLRQFNDPVQVLICLAELEGNDEYRKPLGQIESVLQELIEFASEGDASQEVTKEKGDEATAPEPCDTGRVLVVDDDSMVARMFQKTLTSGIPDLAVDVATDEASTLDLFGKHHHALLVVDAQMPELGAVEAGGIVEEMCNGRGWQVPKYVFCAGSATDGPLSALLEKQPECVCLNKPFRPSDLVEAVRKNLG